MKFDLKNYKREFASFSGKCPYGCLHCYTFNPNYKYKTSNSIDEIINGLKNKKIDVIYVSGHRENFIDAKLGIELCEKLYDEFKCDILITTRSVFNDIEINRI